jgi:hypothetical protein
MFYVGTDEAKKNHCRSLKHPSEPGGEHPKQPISHHTDNPQQTIFILLENFSHDIEEIKIETSVH